SQTSPNRIGTGSEDREDIKGLWILRMALR
ncbi:MAG: hypothetical protein ACI936_001877, partial [Paraglaciecola sp.]